MKCKKIIQLVARYKKGEGVGNVAVAMDEMLRKMGYDTMICDRYLEPADVKSKLFCNENVVFYHLYTAMDPLVPRLKCKKVLVFHNITTPELLIGTDNSTRVQCAAGLYDAAKTCGYFDYAIVFSEYSKRCLIEMGWEADKIEVLPILVRFHKFQEGPSREIIERYQDGYVNILFTGRVYPNKKQEDVIAAFAYYKENFEKRARLLLVGNIAPGNYYPSLLRYAKKLGVRDDIVFTGFVSFADYLAYYHVADLFVCMSAHEGFCIPLVEAMYFELPIIAYHGTAIPDTLGESGVLTNTRNPKQVAEQMNRVIKDTVYRERILDEENKRLKELSADSLERRYRQSIMEIMEKLRKESSVGVTKGDWQEDKVTFELSREFYIKNPIKNKVFQESSRCIIYGAGQAGMRLYDILQHDTSWKEILVCDKYKAGQKSDIFHQEIYTPEEVVKKKKEAVYIISIQDKEYVMEAVILLSSLGVLKGQLYLYDEMEGRIY